jgi:hypothetical protein
MLLIFCNYIGLLVAVALPVLGFYIFVLPGFLTSLAAFISLGIPVLVAASLSYAIREPEDRSVTMHVRNQKWILLIFVLGGLLSSLHFFLFFEQFRLRLDISTPLHIATSILWLAVVLMIIAGIASAIHSRLRPRPAPAPRAR